MFVDDIIANLLISLSLKKFWKSIIIWKSYGQELQLFDIWPILYIVPHQYHDGQNDRTLIK